MWRMCNGKNHKWKWSVNSSALSWHIFVIQVLWKYKLIASKLIWIKWIITLNLNHFNPTLTLWIQQDLFSLMHKWIFEMLLFVQQFCCWSNYCNLSSSNFHFSRNLLCFSFQFWYNTNIGAAIAVVVCIPTPVAAATIVYSHFHFFTDSKSSRWYWLK